MQYTILIHETPEYFANRNNPEKEAQNHAAYTAYTKALIEAGIMRGGAGLEPPSTATTVRLRDGKRQIQDGPFADTKELLAGFYLIEVADLDRALEWAARCPGAANGSVEVRAVRPMLKLD